MESPLRKLCKCYLSPSSPPPPFEAALFGSLLGQLWTVPLRGREWGGNAEKLQGAGDADRWVLWCMSLELLAPGMIEMWWKTFWGSWEMFWLGWQCPSLKGFWFKSYNWQSNHIPLGPYPQLLQGPFSVSSIVHHFGQKVCQIDTFKCNACWWQSLLAQQLGSQ